MIDDFDDIVAGYQKIFPKPPLVEPTAMVTTARRTKRKGGGDSSWCQWRGKTASIALSTLPHVRSPCTCCSHRGRRASARSLLAIVHCRVFRVVQNGRDSRNWSVWAW